MTLDVLPFVLYTSYVCGVGYGEGVAGYFVGHTPHALVPSISATLRLMNSLGVRYPNEECGLISL